MSAEVLATVAGAEVPAPLPESLPLPATSAQVAQFVAFRAAACVGADHANLALLDADRASLRIYLHPLLVADADADRHIDVDLGAPFPIAAAVRDDQAVLLEDLDDYRELFPSALDATVVAGVEASASLPLHRSDGSLLGALAFSWAEPTPFDIKLTAALRAVATLCVETVERAERYDADHELVLAMQQRLLGDLPSLDGIETAACYLPATKAYAVGGDWYEGLSLGPSTMAVVVGDVTGHGIAAAADMALVRGMISALLHSGVAPADVFVELSAMLSQRRSPLLATAALVILDLDAERVTYATAGHPPPLLQLPDGEIRRLEDANAPIIGAQGTHRVAELAPFPKGARLVMYTDGLVERRDRDFEHGIDQAVAVLRELDGSASGDDVVEALLDDLVHGDAEDDIAMVVVRHN